jgi:preprotein translocase subunit SecY
MFQGASQTLPIKVNAANVMPIIFASSFMMFPPIIIQQLATHVFPNSAFMMTLQAAFSMRSYTYNVLYMVLIFLFAYFWVTVQFQPKDMAKNLRDSGSFIPGLRPGKRTANYLESVMMRITYFGASFLAAIAVIPNLIIMTMGISPGVAMILGGTGLLIVVSVSLDLVQKIEAGLLMRSYEGFSGGSGRIKGANG